MLDIPTESSFREGRSVVPPQTVEPIWTDNATENQRLHLPWVVETKQRMCTLREDAWTNRDWHRFVFLHDRQHRWKALKAISSSVGPTQGLAELFRKVWEDSEEIHRERVIVRSLIKSILRFKLQQHLFKPEDRSDFESMPDQLKIYRGAKKWNQYGMSWTVYVDRAVYFATHHYENGTPGRLHTPDYGFVMEKTVPKNGVLFYTNDRLEGEVIPPRFDKGSKSPEGMLGVAEDAGEDAFASELNRQRRHLDPDVVEQAEWRLAQMRASPEPSQSGFQRIAD